MTTDPATEPTDGRPASNEELAALKQLALAGDRVRTASVTYAALGDRLSASAQTAMRRLRGLEEKGLVDRDPADDGRDPAGDGRGGTVRVTAAGMAALREQYGEYRRIFAERAGVVLTGAVASGMGEGAAFVSLPGYAEQFVERLGYEPYPGTLNVELTPESRRCRPEVAAVDPVRVDGWEDGERTFGPVDCYPARLRRRGGPSSGPVHAVVPERTRHDAGVLELLAPDRLRDELALTDGDRVTVEVHPGGTDP